MHRDEHPVFDDFFCVFGGEIIMDRTDIRYLNYIMFVLKFMKTSQLFHVKIYVKI